MGRFARGGGGYAASNYGGSGGSGGRGRGDGNRRPSDPFSKLNFKTTIKIDPKIEALVSDIPFSSGTLAVLEEKGFKTLTPVQGQSYNIVFEGNDVVARSRTGTGKTFAFGLPLIEKLVSQQSNEDRCQNRPMVLVLEPTRELALQVAQELSSVCRKHRLRVEAMFGGVSYTMQERALNSGVHILVATPGRLLDHISRRTLDLSGIRHVVLDEGDTMLEMGFQQDVENILQAVKSQDGARSHSEDDLDLFDPAVAAKLRKAAAASASQRSVQMLLYSATMPSWICTLTDKLMHEPVFLDAVQEGETRLAPTIVHHALKMPDMRDRRQGIKSYVEDLILTHGRGGQTIIFTDTKEEADDLMASGCFGLLKSQVLHGDIGQQSRASTIRAFKEGNIDVLVATDVAARGLDIAGVDLVLHTSAPGDSDRYVHRAGRTGRAGRPGTSVVLHTERERGRLSQLQRELNFSFINTSPPSAVQVMEASTAYATKKMEMVDGDAAKFFAPYASAMLAKARAGALFQQPAVVTGDDDEPAESAPKEPAVAMEEVLARCLAVISNRMTVTTRSLLSGESNMLTLQVNATFRTGGTPDSIGDWHRALSGILHNLLDLPAARAGQMAMGKKDHRDLGTFLLADFNQADAQEILRRMEALPENVRQGLNIHVCEKLPLVIPDERSRDGGGYRSGGGDRGGYRGRSEGGQGGRERFSRDTPRDGYRGRSEGGDSYRGRSDGPRDGFRGRSEGRPAGRDGFRDRSEPRQWERK